MMTTLNMSDQIVKQAYTLCRELLPVRGCWLYGSYARGDYDEESDVDILMSVDMPENELRSYRRAIAEINSRLSLQYGLTVSITVKSSENVEKYARFVPYYQYSKTLTK